jgi:lipoate-protein ligase A
MSHVCNSCYQLFESDEKFKQHQENQCYQLDLPMMEITLKSTIPANILKLLLESNGITALSIKSKYPDFANIHNTPRNIGNPPSAEDFERFKAKYFEALYPKEQREPDIEEISSESESETEEELSKKKKTK